MSLVPLRRPAGELRKNPSFPGVPHPGALPRQGGDRREGAPDEPVVFLKVVIEQLAKTIRGQEKAQLGSFVAMTTFR